jgi:hypothetical protein
VEDAIISKLAVGREPASRTAEPAGDLAGLGVIIGRIPDTESDAGVTSNAAAARPGARARDTRATAVAAATAERAGARLCRDMNTER